MQSIIPAIKFPPDWVAEVRGRLSVTQQALFEVSLDVFSWRDWKDVENKT